MICIIFLMNNVSQMDSNKGHMTTSKTPTFEESFVSKPSFHPFPYQAALLMKKHQEVKSSCTEQFKVVLAVNPAAADRLALLVK